MCHCVVSLSSGAQAESDLPQGNNAGITHRYARRLLFAVLLAFGAALRLWVSTLGWNYDLESWALVAALVDKGENVYIHTFRLPYGPIWAYVTWLALRLQRALGLSDLRSFHLLLAAFLSAIDVGIAVALARMRGYLPAILFTLCPVSILITGYHSQIDNFAILPALLSWYFLERHPERPAISDLIAAAVLMGLSLSIKHVFLFFPLWLLAWPSRRLLHRLLYACVAYTTFLAVFIPFASTPEGMDAVRRVVFGYRGFGWLGYALLPRLIADSGLWLKAFTAGMLISGLAISRFAPRQAFYVYPISLLILTAALTNQYLTIPVISFAVYWQSVAMWVYVVVSTFALFASAQEIGAVQRIQPLARALRERGFEIRANPTSSLLPQICLLLFAVSALAGVLIRSMRGRARRPSLR